MRYSFSGWRGPRRSGSQCPRTCCGGPSDVGFSGGEKARNEVLQMAIRASRAWRYWTRRAFHPRHAVNLARGARLTLLELSLGDGLYLRNRSSISRCAKRVFLVLAIPSRPVTSTAALR